MGCCSPAAGMFAWSSSRRSQRWTRRLSTSQPLASSCSEASSPRPGRLAAAPRCAGHELTLARTQPASCSTNDAEEVRPGEAAPVRPRPAQQSRPDRLPDSSEAAAPLAFRCRSAVRNSFHGGGPGVRPRTRGSCPTIPVARCRGSPRPAVNPATYTPRRSHPRSPGTVTVDIAAGAAQDSSGNPSAAADQFSITANTAAPTVTITSSASEPVTGAFSIAVTFSEPVNGFELADLVVGNGNASGLQGRRRGRSPDRGRPGRQPWPPQPRAPIIRVHAPHGLHSRRHSSHFRRSLPVSARRSFQAHQFNRTQ